MMLMNAPVKWFKKEKRGSLGNAHSVLGISTPTSQQSRVFFPLKYPLIGPMLSNLHIYKKDRSVNNKNLKISK